MARTKYPTYLVHHGILGMHWGERKYQYDDGSLTPLGRKHYGVGDPRGDGESDTKTKKNKITINIGGKRTDKIDTGHLSNTHKAEEKESSTSAPRTLTSDEKKDLINSGNAEEIYKYYRQFSRQEMNDAIQRVRDVESLNSFINKAATSQSGGNDDVLETKSKFFSIKGLKERRRQNTKAEILKKNDLDAMLQNADMFSTQEINDAINRSQKLSMLEDQAKKSSKVTKVLDFTMNAIDRADQIKSRIDKVKRMLGDDGDASKPKISFAGKSLDEIRDMVINGTDPETMEAASRYLMNRNRAEAAVNTAAQQQELRETQAAQTKLDDMISKLTAEQKNALTDDQKNDLVEEIRKAGGNLSRQKLEELQNKVSGEANVSIVRNQIRDQERQQREAQEQQERQQREAQEQQERQQREAQEQQERQQREAQEQQERQQRETQERQRRDDLNVEDVINTGARSGVGGMTADLRNAMNDEEREYVRQEVQRYGTDLNQERRQRLADNLADRIRQRQQREAEQEAERQREEAERQREETERQRIIDEATVDTARGEGSRRRQADIRARIDALRSEAEARRILSEDRNRDTSRIEAARQRQAEARARLDALRYERQEQDRINREIEDAWNNQNNQEPDWLREANERRDRARERREIGADYHAQADALREAMRQRASERTRESERRAQEAADMLSSLAEEQLNSIRTRNAASAGSQMMDLMRQAERRNSSQSNGVSSQMMDLMNQSARRREEAERQQREAERRQRAEERIREEQAAHERAVQRQREAEARRRQEEEASRRAAEERQREAEARRRQEEEASRRAAEERERQRQRREQDEQRGLARLERQQAAEDRQRRWNEEHPDQARIIADREATNALIREYMESRRASNPSTINQGEQTVRDLPDDILDRPVP